MNGAPTVEQARRLVTAALAEAGIVSARSEAQELLCAVLGLSRLELVLRSREALSPQAWQRLSDLAAKRAQRVPLQHLLGWVEWGDLRLEVSPDALIPRPETEVLLELASAELRAQGKGAPRVLDVGSGTGALALALKRRFPEARMSGSDVSPAALALARKNARLHGLDVTWLRADALSGVIGPFDLLLSNPSYLPSADRACAPPELSFDPALALYSGPDGLELARRLCRDAPRVLAEGAPLLLELDPRNVRVLAAELRAQGWHTRIFPDLNGQERFLRANLSDSA